MQLHKLSLELPPFWFEFKNAGREHEPNYSDFLDVWEVDDDIRQRLLFGLKNAWAFASANISENSRRWVMIQDARAGRVDAVLSLDVVSREPGDDERYSKAARDEVSVGGNLEVINRTVSTRDAPAGPAVVIHDFVLPHSDEEERHPATERAVAGVFPLTWDVIAEFSLVTQDLGLFADIQGVLVSIVDSVSIAVESEAVQ
jgi:hypothetical protein